MRAHPVGSGVGGPLPHSPSWSPSQEGTCTSTVSLGSPGSWSSALSTHGDFGEAAGQESPMMTLAALARPPRGCCLLLPLLPPPPGTDTEERQGPGSPPTPGPGKPPEAVGEEAVGPGPLEPLWAGEVPPQAKCSLPRAWQPLHW